MSFNKWINISFITNTIPEKDLFHGVKRSVQAVPNSVNFAKTTFRKKFKFFEFAFVPRYLHYAWANRKIDFHTEKKKKKKKNTVKKKSKKTEN